MSVCKCALRPLRVDCFCSQCGRRLAARHDSTTSHRIQVFTDTYSKSPHTLTASPAPTHGKRRRGARAGVPHDLVMELASLKSNQRYMLKELRAMSTVNRHLAYSHYSPASHQPSRTVGGEYLTEIECIDVLYRKDMAMNSASVRAESLPLLATTSRNTLPNCATDVSDGREGARDNGWFWGASNIDETLLNVKRNSVGGEEELTQGLFWGENVRTFTFLTQRILTYPSYRIEQLPSSCICIGVRCSLQ